MKCKHRNIDLLEIAREELSWNIADGKAYSSNRRAGDLDDYIGIECHDCGLLKGYSRRSKNNPKWVEDYISYINSGDAARDEEQFAEEEDQRRQSKRRGV
jgi:hypothetical protein